MAVSKKPAGANAKKTGTKKSPPASRVDVGRRLLLIFFLLLALALLGGIIALVCIIPGKMMYENPRFKLKRVEIVGSGYWNTSKHIDLISKIGFALGENIFTLDVGKIRQIAVTKISNIEDAEVSLILPNMIVFKIKERIPIAQIKLKGKLDEDWVIDAKGKIFKKAESSAAKRKLPLIIGESDNPKTLPAALSLISAANREFKDIRVEEIILEKSFINAKIKHGTEMVEYEVWFPNEGDFTDLLNKFQNTIVQLYLRNQRVDGYIDLRFKGQATIKM